MSAASIAKTWTWPPETGSLEERVLDA